MQAFKAAGLTRFSSTLNGWLPLPTPTPIECDTTAHARTAAASYVGSLYSLQQKRKRFRGVEYYLGERHPDCAIHPQLIIHALRAPGLSTPEHATRTKSAEMHLTTGLLGGLVPFELKGGFNGNRRLSAFQVTAEENILSKLQCEAKRMVNTHGGVVALVTGVYIAKTLTATSNPHLATTAVDSITGAGGGVQGHIAQSTQRANFIFALHVTLVSLLPSTDPPYTFALLYKLSRTAFECHTDGDDGWVENIENGIFSPMYEIWNLP